MVQSFCIFLMTLARNLKGCDKYYKGEESFSEKEELVHHLKLKTGDIEVSKY